MIISITTGKPLKIVGFGDYYPTTNVGRFISKTLN